MKTREQILNEMIKEHTPMMPVNPAMVPNDNESSYATERDIDRMIRRAKQQPMRVVAGPVPKGTRNGRPVTVVGDDEDLLRRTAHVRLKHETTMNPFYARVGLGAAEIRKMSKSEISHFVEIATANTEVESCFKFQQVEEPKRDLLGRILDRILVGKRPAFEPEPQPPTFILTD
jgi:hypothetical protein